MRACGSARARGAGAVGGAATVGGSSLRPRSVRKPRTAVAAPTTPIAIKSVTPNWIRAVSRPREAFAANSTAAVVATPSLCAAETAAWVARSNSREKSPVDIAMAVGQADES